MRTLAPLLLVLAACRGGFSSDPSSSEPTSTPSTPTGSTDQVGPTGDTGAATAPLAEEVFEAPLLEPIDIVFVVDNSCSMSDNQADLGASMQGFVDILDGGGTAWRVGVTSTDIDAAYGNPLEGRLVVVGGLLGVHYDSSPDPVNVLEAMMLVGIDGSGEEKGIGAAYLAAELRRDEANAGFFRDEAGLHIVVLSDEQDQTELARPPVIELDPFIDWLDGLRAPNRPVSFSSIVCTAASSGCLSFDVGTRYMTVSQEIGGVVASILDPIDVAAQSIATAIVENTGLRSLELAGVPADPATLEVLVDGGALDAGGFTYDATTNTIELTELPPRGAEVVVRYQE